MSTIGKIFVVINLLLAAVFVGFAATYLQQAADYKKLYTEEQTARSEGEERQTQAFTALSTQKTGIEAKLGLAQASLKRVETDNQGLTDENARLEKQLTSMGGSIEVVKNDYSAIKSIIENSTREYTEKVEMALAALSERDNAVREKETAVADLADARNAIKELQEQVEMKNGMLAEASDNIAEQGIMLANFSSKFPGIAVPDLAMPDLRGTVSHVANNLVTIVVTENPTDSEIKAGYRFAIAGGGSYKGEALVTQVSGNTAFCRLTINAGGASVNIGDLAMTHTY